MSDTVMPPNYFAGVGAGRTPEFIKVKQAARGT